MPLGVIGVLIVLGSALGGLLWSRTTVSRTDVLVAAHDIPAATETAPPPEEPPEILSFFHGFLQFPKCGFRFVTPNANS